MPTNHAQLISAIRIKNLFGLYSYSLPENEKLLSAAILYGDNGVGKSTILRLAFHLLSSAGDKGHRTALYEGNFESLEVDLASGVTVRASRESDNRQKLKMTVSKAGKDIAIWEHHPGTSVGMDLEDNGRFIVTIGPDGRPKLKIRDPEESKSKKDLVPRGEAAYLAALKDYAPTVFLLNAERRLDSDAVADPSDEIELRRMLRMDEPKRITDLVVRSRQIALSQALASAARWISRKAVHGTNLGSMNVHSVYTNVLRHLVRQDSKSAQPEANASDEQLVKRLIAIEAKTTQLARFELATELTTIEIRKALLVKSVPKRRLAAGLMKPYVESLEGRLKAVDPIYQIIDRFVSIVNSLLTDKTINFQLSTGFSITNRLGAPLTASQLSSGEQQLLLLFCYVLTARDQPSVFMIDEPEISLNIKWQRTLVQSLLNITDGADIQFIFASHSIELLTQHKSRVVKLVNQNE
jgi:energy-coupling factor transporter ATP-binding protein EcfA2